MKEMHLITGHLRKVGTKPAFILAAMAGSVTIREWQFDTEKERSDFLLGRNARPRDIEFSDDDLRALGIDRDKLR
jgi:hypothetical protein